MLDARVEVLRMWLKDQVLLELPKVTSRCGSGRVAHFLPPSPLHLVSQDFCSQVGSRAFTPLFLRREEGWAHVLSEVCIEKSWRKKPSYFCVREKSADYGRVT